VIDLHTHTSASDGTLAPAALVELAVAEGLSALAVTDHDTLDGLAEASSAGARAGLRVVPGIELAALPPWSDEREVHVLGYFVDPGAPRLRALLERMLRGRRERGASIVERLRAAGVRVEQVTAYRTVPAAPAEEQLIPPDGFARWDAVVLTSATAVNVLFRTLEARRGPEPARCWLRENGPAALGRTAEGALEALRVAPTVRAPQPSVQDLAAALLDAFGRGK